MTGGNSGLGFEICRSLAWSGLAVVLTARQESEGRKAEAELGAEGGARGIGELGAVGVSAAIGNAVFHATGKRIRELPIRIERVLATRRRASAP